MTKHGSQEIEESCRPVQVLRVAMLGRPYFAPISKRGRFVAIVSELAK